MTKIYMDESGYTGYDLLNKDQPFQAISAVRINEDEAERLIKFYFPNNSSELKHKKLSNRKSQWKYLIELQRELLKTHDVFSHACNKKYLLILLFLDNCVEPFYYDNGINFYENGHNYALASSLYYGGPIFWGKENFDNLLYYYQRASKTGLDINVQFLSEHAKSLMGKEFSDVLLPISSLYFKCIDELKCKDMNTDITFIIILGLITHIEKYVKDEYIIIHDTSKELMRYSEQLKKLIGIQEQRSFTKTQITTVSFPLNLKSVNQSNSKNSFGIQLADILAGAIVENANAMLNPSLKNEYNQEVITLYNDQNLIHMLPSLDFEQNSEFRKNNNSESFIEFMSQNLS